MGERLPPACPQGDSPQDQSQLSEVPLWLQPQLPLGCPVEWWTLRPLALLFSLVSWVTTLSKPACRPHHTLASEAT